ncbi:unnamed protein product [Urochloa decumbens]|uniref:Sulfotransferase n=1 Tax=Urochloa decumbens TaxID=240449 RepID=A0ABC9H5D5_9POAL
MAAPANTSGAAAAAVASLLPSRPATPHSNMAEILPSLPLETRCPPFHLRLYKGFWQPEKVLVENIPAIDAHFEPRPNDIFLASFPKSGTTWLKSLAFAMLNRAVHSPFDFDHPLCRHNPHDCVRFLEAISFNETKDEPHDVLGSSPRVLATHLPYSMLPERIAGEGSMGRIVYICREPKDVLVSGWLFTKKTSAALGLDEQSYTLQEALDLFCEGRCVNGPHWQHVLEYWEESLRRPDKALFLKYEEMLREPASNLRKLAEFMGCKFSKEEEDGGLVDAIVELCSLHKLKSMEVNRNGCNSLAVRNEAYFRKGVVGDWGNHLTPEMAQKLDKLVEDALQGSGLDLSSPTVFD